MVIVQDASGEWVEVTDEGDMEQACLEENRACSSQCTWAQIPFTTQPVLDEFRYLAIMNAAK